jgi:hypothetical protein
MPGSAATAATLVAFLAIPGTMAAREQTAPQTRVTIRGSGSNVAIERTSAPAAGRAAKRAPAVSPAIGEAVRLKSEGLDDEALVSYLRERRAELPPVVAVRDVERLRAAGAGESVMAFLAGAAALEVGETGEGGPAAGAAPSPAPGFEGGYEIAYGYPAGIAYPFGAYAPPRARGSHFHGFPRQKRFPFHPGRPASPRHHSPSPPGTRRGMPR